MPSSQWIDLEVAVLFYAHSNRHRITVAVCRSLQKLRRSVADPSRNGGDYQPSMPVGRRRSGTPSDKSTILGGRHAPVFNRSCDYHCGCSQHAPSGLTTTAVAHSMHVIMHRGSCDRHAPYSSRKLGSLGNNHGAVRVKVKVEVYVRVRAKVDEVTVREAEGVHHRGCRCG